MKIRKKMLMGFLAVTLVILIAGVITSLSISEMTAQTRTVDREFSTNQQAIMYQNGAKQLQIGAFLYAQGSKEQGKQFIDMGKAGMTEGGAKLLANISDPALQSELIEIVQLKGKVIDSEENVITIADSNVTNRDKLLSQELQTLEGRAEALNLRLSNFIDTALGSQNKVGNALADAEATGNATVITCAIAIVAALICSLAIALYLSDEIVRPIVSLTETADKVSKGESDQKIDINSKDEIEDLGSSFQRMINAYKMLESMCPEEEEVKK
jgi:HAMP domain-containing protein